MTFTQPDLIRDLVTALRRGGIAADWRDVADIVWLTRSGWAATAHEGHPRSPAHLSGTEEAPDGPPRSVDSPPPAQSLGPASHPAPVDLELPGPAAEASYIVTTDAVNAAAATSLAAVAPRRFALPHRRELERSFRPLKRRYRTSRRRELDLDATIDHFCESGVLAPVLQRAWEPWLDLSLVVDTSPTMVIWRETAEVFGDLLERSGTFRTVRRWSMDADAPTLRLSSGTATHRPEEVVTPSGRQLVLVLTDGVGAVWSRDPIWRALSGWGRSSPTAILQLLRRGPASRTALGDPGVAARITAPGAPSSRLRFDQPWWAFEEVKDVVPVVTLTASDLLHWAYSLAGAADASLDAVPAIVRTASAEPVKERGAWLARLDDSRLREVLNTGLSPRAHRLAVLLSAIDPTIDLIRIVMEKLVPEAELSDLAELLVLGVLEADGDRLRHLPAAQSVLSESLGATDAMSVWIAAAPHLAATGSPSPLGLVLGEGTETAEESLLRIPAAIVERLGIGQRRSVPAPAPISAAPEPTIAEPRPRQTSPQVEASGLAALDALIDLTVSISRAEASDLLSWTFTTPHPVTVPDEQVVTRLAPDAADTFALRKIREMGRLDRSPAAQFQVAGVATEVATAMPTWFWDVLGQVWRIAKDANRLPTLLFVSQESRVPWELATTDEEFVTDRTLVDPEAPQVLGAQVIMGRWRPPRTRRPDTGRSSAAVPAEAIAIKNVAVVVGEFPPASGFRRLVEGIDEAEQLTTRYPSVRVTAKESDVTLLLSGRLLDRGMPVHAQVLHIVSHGEIDPDSPWHSGVILSDSSIRINESMVSHSEFTRAAEPLVFVNCSQLATPGGGAIGEAGLAAAFLQAGARAFIAPLWNVNDTIAKDIALSFYAETLGKGRRVGEVMRELRAHFTNAFAERDQTTPLAYVYYGHPNLRLLPAFDEPQLAVDRAAQPATDYQALVRDLGFATVQEFQRSVGLNTDGVVGPSTRAALLNARDGASGSASYPAAATSDTEPLLEARGQAPPATPTADQFAYDYFTRGEYEEAAAHYEQALAVSEASQDQSGIAANRHQLGLLAYYRKDYDAARAHYRQAIDALQQVPDHSGVAACYGRLGQVAHAQGDFEQAEALYQQALELDQQIEDREGRATDHHRLGLLAEDRGDYEGARSQYEQSLALDKQLEKKAGVSTNLHRLGSLAEVSGDYSGALALYLQELPIRREIGDRPGEATALASVADMHDYLGEFDHALDIYEQALTARREIGDQHGLATTLARISNLLSNLGRRQEAIAPAEEAVTLYRELAGTNPASLAALATAMNDLSMRYSEVGRHQEAIALAEEAVTLYQELADHNPAAFTLDLAGSLNNLANRQAGVGDRAGALTSIQEAVTLYRELAKTNPMFLPDLATSLTNLGNRYSDLGRIKEALAPTAEAVALRRDLTEGHSRQGGSTPADIVTERSQIEPVGTEPEGDRQGSSDDGR